MWRTRAGGRGGGDLDGGENEKRAEVPKGDIGRNKAAMFLWGCEQYGNKGRYPCKSFSVTSTSASLLLPREPFLSFSSWLLAAIVSCSPLFTFAPFPSLWFLLRFGGDRRSRRRPPRPPPLRFLPPQLLFRPFSRPGNNLRPGCSSSERYFYNVLTDNRFSFCSDRLSGFAVVGHRKSAIYVYICIHNFLPFTLPHLTLSNACEISKTSMVVQWPDSGDYPP